MPDFLGYESHLSTVAAAFIISQPRRRQRQLLDLADQLSCDPFHPGDYCLRDVSGRDIANRLFGQYLFTYWVDHAGKEVRVVEILKI